MRNIAKFAIFVLLAVLLVQLPLLAQYAGASLSATVSDKTGAVIPNAKISIKNEATNAIRETVTNTSGLFTFPSLQPGKYTLTVAANGMQTYEAHGVTLNQGNVVTLPTIELDVAQARQEVRVVSEGEVVVPTDSGHLSQTLNKQMVEDLSIVGRNAGELMKIMPGMAATSGLNQSMWNSYTTQTNNGPIGNFSASGTQPNGAMTMTSDGANLLDPGNQGTQTANINQNQVQEVSIMLNAYGAEFAKGPMTFQAIGKSGSAQFHGSGYLYARHGVFNAIDSYSKSQGGKPLEDKYYYPGGDLGGPVILPGVKFNKNRDKLFFYTAYEYMNQQPAGNLLSYFVPTTEMKQGNFSPAHLASLGPNWANARSSINVAPGGNATSNDGLQFPGGIIPASLIDPNSAIYMKLFPAPNADPRTNSTGSNYQYFNGPPSNRWEYRLRGDYNISEKTKLFFSWNTQHEKQLNPISIWWSIGGSLPYPTSQDANQTANIYSANLVHVFSPTLTNEFVFSQANFLNPIKLGDPDAVNPEKLGFKMTGLFKNPYTPQIPNVFGWHNAAIGFATYPYGSPWAAGGGNAFGKLSQAPAFSDNVTKVYGRHNLKAGFYWDFARNNQTGGGLDSSTQGVAEYANWGARSTGNPMADLVMARATVFRQLSDAAVADFKYRQWGFFLNDQWKATRRLSLTLGIRFDHFGAWVPADGPGLAVFDRAKYNNTSAAGAWTGLTWNKIDPSIPASGFPTRPLFYLPRFGFAYDIFGTGKTVLRGGAGQYRYQLAYNSVSAAALNVPLNIPNLATTWGCCVGWNDFPNYSPTTSGVPGLGSGVNGVLTKGDDKTPNTWTYNFTISQRVPWSSVVELQYSGNRSNDLMLRGGLSNLNLIPQGAFFRPNPKTGVILNPADSGFPVNDYYPLANYTEMTLIGHGSYSNYNALIATWQKTTGRLTFTTNYTFSKVLGIRDNQTDNGVGAGNTLNPFSLDANYGVLSWDRTHIFNAAYVVNLPNFVSGNRFAKGAVNGWVVSGITQLQSGAPLQPNTQGTMNVSWPGDFSNQRYLGTNAITLVPRLTCDPRSGLADGQYFNPTCFTPPTGGQNGDVIWPYIKGPALFNSDLALYKRFTITERQRVELRFSAFNFLNHPLKQFNAAGNSDIQLNFNNNGTLAQRNVNALTTGFPRFTTGRRVVEFTLKYNF